MANVLCMEIGRSIVRYAEVKMSGKHVTIYKTGMFEVDDEMTKDGKVKVTENVVASIRDGLERDAVSATEVFFAVDSSRILFQRTEIPMVANRLIGSTLELSFSEMFPRVDETAYHLSWVNKGKIKKEDQTVLDLEVYAVPNDLSESYYNLAVSLGLTPRGLSDTSHGIITLMEDSFKFRNVASICIGDDSTAVSIVVKGEMVFSKTLPVGVENTIDTIVKSSMTLEDIGRVGALELLYSQNIILRQLPKEMTKLNQEATVQYDATVSLASLIQAIEQSLTGFLQKENIQLQDVYISGLGAGIAGISQLLAYEFGAPVTIVRQDSRLSISKDCADEVLLLGSYAAVGSCVDSTNLFTLLEQAGGNAAKARQIDSFVFLTGFAILALGAGFGGYKMIEANTRKNEAERAEKRLEMNLQQLREAKIEEKYDAYVLANSYYEEVKGLYNETESENEDMTDFLEELASVLPLSAAVTQIQLTPTSARVNIQCEDKFVAAGVVHLMRSMTTVNSMSCDGISENEETGLAGFEVRFGLKTAIERHGVLDENGNWIIDNKKEEPEVEEKDEPTDNVGYQDDNPEPEIEVEDVSSMIFEYQIAENTLDENLMVDSVYYNGQSINIHDLTIDNLVDSGVQTVPVPDTDPNTKLNYAGSEVVRLLNPYLLPELDEDNVFNRAYIGTSADGQIYAVSLNYKENDTFDIPDLNINSDSTEDEIKENLALYDAFEMGDETFYFIKNDSVTLVIKFIRIMDENGNDTFTLNQLIIIDNSLADIAIKGGKPYVTE